MHRLDFDFAVRTKSAKWDVSRRTSAMCLYVSISGGCIRCKTAKPHFMHLSVVTIPSGTYGGISGELDRLIRLLRYAFDVHAGI